MSRYAESTTVSPDRTEAEMKALLRKHGAQGRLIGEYGRDLVVMFVLHGRQIRFVARLPDPRDVCYRHDNGNYRKQERPETMQRSMWERDVRQRWRSLLLRIKARLEELADLLEQEADADPVALIDEVFMAQILLPDRHTVGEYMQPQIEQTYRTGHMPPLLPGASTPILLPPPEESPDGR